MSIDQSTLANRLREAREQAGITQEEAASSLKLPRTAVVQIENGNRAVSSLELLRFAKAYRRDIGDFFGESTLKPDEGPELVLYRLSDMIGQNVDLRREVDRCLEICRAGAELEEILDAPKRSGPPTYKLSAPRSVMDAVVQGQLVAEQERLRLGLGDSPIRDLSDLLNSNGVWASGIKHLPDSISGLFLSDGAFGMTILVNFEHPRARKRFSYAHEYAHVLLDRDLQANVSEQRNANDLREKRANAFAAAFLMPESGVKSFIRDLNKGQPSRLDTPLFDVTSDRWDEASLRPAPGSQTLSYQDVALLANHFRVSFPAAVYRLKSLSIVSAAEATSLLSQEHEANEFVDFLDLFRANERTDNGKPDRELVTQVAHLVIEAYRRDEISRGRVLDLAKVLRLDGRQLLQFAQASKKE